MKGDPSARAILVAFATVALAFVASTAYTESRLEAIDEGARDLVTSTLPDIDRVTGLRSDLRQLEVAAADLVDDTALTGRVAPEHVERARGRLESDRSQVFADATADRTRVGGELDAVDAIVGRVVERCAAGDVVGARAIVDAELHPAVTRADGDARAIVERSASSADTLVTSIAAIRKRSLRSAVVLDALCGALAVLAAAVVLRTVSRYTRLLREHTHMVEARASELEQFAGRVAHDILSPLSVVTLAVGHAKRAVHDPAVLASLQRGDASVKRVTAIVNGLLDFARSGARPTTDARADVREVVADLVEELRPAAATAGITLVAPPPPPLAIACSRGVLTSIVANLARNAIKYMGDAPVRSIGISVTEAGRRARIEVADTGPGLPPGMEDAVFEPYVRGREGAKQPGIGLGLATVKRLAVAHGGNVAVRSSPGEGCSFVVELPVATSTESAVAIREVPLDAAR